VDTLEFQDQQALRTQLGETNDKLDGLLNDLRAIDDELEALASERHQYDLLRQVCDSLDELGELDAARLFWGERIECEKGAERVRQARESLEAFQARLGEIDARREAVAVAVRQAQQEIEILEDDLFDAQEQEERRKLEWIVEREISALPARRVVMPWTRGGEDDRRFNKALAASLLVSMLLGLLLPQIDLPLPEPWEVIDVPERLARLVREERPPPPPTSTIEEPPPEQKPPEPEPEPIEEPLTPTDLPVLANSPEPKQAPQKAEKKQTETKGILAFKEKFANLASSTPSAKLGADARISSSGDLQAGRPERSMVTTQAPGSSGGINLAALSRGVGGGGGGGQIAGVQLTRASSTIGGSGGQDRPLSNGAGAGRTDEEIQIVFDRHKAALYRLYNRELRRDPTLQGQMVLRIRIEPDGSVSLCELQGTDMNAPNLSAQVLDRVRTFDFGAKEGIPAVTILYPIDFLPAA
jgi:outer membrane biosynthesis protein TonB